MFFVTQDGGLTTAGYTRSTSSKLDMIVEFFIRHKI